MATVDKIDITSVSVTKTAAADRYDITLAWELDEGSQGYDKNFWLIPYYEGGHDSLILIDCGGKSVCDATVKDVPLSGGKQYTLAMTADQSRFTDCRRVPITTRTYEGVGVRYENDVMTIGWEPPDQTIREGLLTISFSNDKFFAYGVPGNTCLYTFAIPDLWRDTNCCRMPLPSAWFSTGECKVVLTPYAAEESSGPNSAAAVLPLKPLEITSVSLGEIKDHAREVTVKLKGEHAQYIQLGFYDGGELVCLSAPVAFSSSVTYTLQGQNAYNAEKLQLAVYLCDKDAKSLNRLKTSGNTIPLAAPRLSIDISNDPPVLSWSHSAPGCTAYSLQLGTAAPKDVYGASYAFTEAAHTIMDSDIRLTPKYGSKQGAEARIRAFREGFYYDESRLAFRSSSFKSRGVSFPLPASAFSKPLKETVEKGAFKLEPSSPGYRAVISGDQPARADFTAWLTELFEKNLTPRGYYQIRDAMSRLPAVTEAERLWYAAGIDPSSPKRADILPGMTLRVEYAHYMPQTSHVAADLAGYTPGSVAEYAVEFSDGALNVSPYLLKSMGYFTYSGEPCKDPLFHAAAGGTDFFDIGFKRPYWVLRHPDKVLRSESFSNLYPSCNTALYAVSAWKDTLSPDSDTKDHMVFRGRSTVSLLYTVFINNTPQLVPVGETADSLMERLGCCGQSPRLWRNTGAGGRAEVFWFSGAGILLLPGDRIEL